MQQNRRDFLGGGMVAALGAAAASAVQKEKSGAGAATAKGTGTGRRPVLYNGDDTYYYYDNGMPERMDRKYLEGIVNDLASAKVGIFSQVVYDAGRCFYDSKVCEPFDRDDKYHGFSPETGRYKTIYNWRMVTNFRRLVSEGNDPLLVFIEASHKRGLKFLACLRMNDRHSIHVENPPLLARQHPEFIMKRKDGSLIGGMDFQFPEVWDFVFKPMEELARQFEVDGLELDWMRWAQMFSEDVPKEQRLAIMIDYHRRTRKMLDEVGQRKGKHLLLSIRVPQTLEECETLGFDVATYVREGLIDILCPTDFLFTDPYMLLEPYKRLTRGTKVLLLPTIHSQSGWEAGYPTTENHRAVAHNYYEQGADGISVYNWFTPRESNLPENFAALADFSDPEKLTRSPREYLFNPIWGNRRSQTGRLIYYMAEVPRTAPGKSAVFPLFVKEDFYQVHAGLKWKVENLTLQDEIRLALNGKPLDPGQYSKTYFAAGKDGGNRWLETGWAAGPYYLFEMTNAERFLKDGANELEITLVRPNEALDLPIRLFEVRVEIRPKSATVRSVDGRGATPAHP